MNHQEVRFARVLYPFLGSMLLFAFIFPSCDAYESDFPLFEADNAVIVDELTGNWVELKGFGRNQHTLFPDMEINFQPFNDREYVVTAKQFKGKKQEIESISNWKVHCANFGERLLINAAPLHFDKHIIWEVENLSRDSLVARYLVRDSLKIKPANSAELLDEILHSSKEQNDKLFSRSRTFQRWRSIDWELATGIDSDTEFCAVYLLGKSDEVFGSGTTAHFLNLISTCESENMTTAIDFFSKVHLTTDQLLFWGSREIALIFLEENDFILIQYDSGSDFIRDLTTGHTFRAGTENPWPF